MNSYNGRVEARFSVDARSKGEALSKVIDALEQQGSELVIQVERIDPDLLGEEL